MEDMLLNKIRWVKRKVLKETSKNPMLQTAPIKVEITVLQQQWGKWSENGQTLNYYWKDVPMVEEKKVKEKKVIKRFICWVDYTGEEGIKQLEAPVVFEAETMHKAMYAFHKGRDVDLEPYEEFLKTECTGWGMWCEEIVTNK